MTPARWRRSGLAPPRHAKRRLVIGVAVVAVLALVVGEVIADVVASRARVSKVSAATYVAAVLPIVDESNSLATTMHTVRQDARGLGRAELESTLGRLVADAVDLTSQLSTLGLSPPDGRSGALLSRALADRASASRVLTGGIALAIGPQSGPRAVDSGVARARAASLIGAAGAQFLASDRYYGEFTRSLPAGSGAARLPISVWVTTPAAWAPGALSAWVAELGSATKLALRRRLLIVAVTVEPPVVRVTGLPTTTTTSTTTTTTTTSTTTTSTTTTTTTGSSSTRRRPTTTTSPRRTTTTTTTTTTLQLPPPGSVSVLPPTGGIVVMLVVANAGDVSEPAVFAAAVLTPSATSSKSGGKQTSGTSPTAGTLPGATSGTGPPASTARSIGPLAAGASAVVYLAALPVSSGRSYTLTVSVGPGTAPTGPVLRPVVGPGQTDTVKIQVAAA